MGPRTKPEFEATLLEKLMIPFGILGTLSFGLYTAATAPFRGSSGAATYKAHVGHALLRTLFAFLNRAQVQYIVEFIPEYEKWCRKNGQQPDIVTLKSGVQVFWLGARDAQYILLYFHGGGYSIDGNDGHILWWRIVQQSLAAEGKTLAICYVSYSLVPHETYPRQFQECTEALQYLLTECNRNPSEVIISGDSAGGNMALAILAHLSKPSPDVPEVKLTEPLKAVIVLSPWVDFGMDWPSRKYNHYKDIVSIDFIGDWASDYLDGHESDVYTEPLKAPSEFWRGAKTEKLLCVSGADEVLIDSIDEWVKKYKAANPDTTTYVRAANEIHVHPVVYSSYSAETGEQGEAIKSFLKANL